MHLTEENRILTNFLILKGYGARRLIKEYLQRAGRKPHWTVLKQLRDTGLVDRKAGSGRPRTARADENINLFYELVLSREDAPQSYNIVI